MKKTSDPESNVTSLLSETTSSDEIIVYATLVIGQVPEKALKAIAGVFQLTLKSLKTNYYLQAVQPHPGQHKLHTLDLLAAAICIYQKFPKARVSLNIRHDFMMERRNKEKELNSELQFLPEGHLQISSACQLFLAQAGLGLGVQESSRMFTADEVVSMAENFDRVQKMKQGA